MQLPVELRRFRSPFLVLVAFELALFGILAKDRRLPTTPDTAAYYEAQVEVLSNAGRRAPEVDVAQSGILQTALVPVGSWFSGADVHRIFLLGLFLEQAIFLAGVWLLARKLLNTTRAAFFASAAAAGTSLWGSQIWLAFHACYAVPLVLWLAHEFLETGSRAKGALAANLLALQALGQLRGGVLLPMLAVAFYFGARVVVFRNPLRPPGSRLAARDALPIALAALPLVLVILFGTDRSSPSGPRPGPVGTASILADALLGVTPWRDVQSYAGVLTLAFAAMVLLHAPAFFLRLAAVAAAAALVLAGLRTFAGEALPALAGADLAVLVVPFLKILVAFVGGKGLDLFLEKTADVRRPARFAGSTLAAVGLALTLVPGFLERSDRWAASFAEARPEDLLARHQDPRLYSDILGMAAVTALASGALILLGASGSRRLPMAIALILLIHPLDVFGWKYRATWERTAARTEEESSLRRLSSSDSSGSARARSSRLRSASADGAPSSAPVRTAAAWILAVNALGWILALPLLVRAGATRRPPREERR